MMIPDHVIETIRAFQESRAVLTAIELDLFSAVGSGGTAEEIAGRANTDARATEMLLNAMAALGLVSKEANRYRNTEAGAAVKEGRAGLMHTVHLWQRWSTLTGCVRAGTAIAEREAQSRGEEWTEAFIAAMHRNASERAPAIVAAVGADGVRRMLDVGGGSGAYSIAFARADASLRSDILDLPRVCEIAQRHIKAAGLSDRVHTRPGDLYTSDYGSGYDLVWISQICHMMGPEENLAMVRKSFAALAPRGRVAIQDFILDRDKTAPRHAALFALNMLVGTKNGNTYSADEYSAWLRAAGFDAVRHVNVPGGTGLITAVRPA